MDRATLHAAFHRPSTAPYRAVDTAVWVLIVLSVALIALEAFVEEPVLGALRLLDKGILGVFAIELSPRVLTYRPPSLKVFRGAPLGVLRTPDDAPVPAGSEVVYLAESPLLEPSAGAL